MSKQRNRTVPRAPAAGPVSPSSTLYRLMELVATGLAQDDRPPGPSPSVAAIQRAAARELSRTATAHQDGDDNQPVTNL